MEMFSSWIQNGKNFFLKYCVEVVLVGISFFGLVLSLYLFFILRFQINKKTVVSVEKTSTTGITNTKFTEHKKMYVDISGSVQHPGLYLIDEYSRLDTILAKAGGLNQYADEQFFYRNFNLADILSDGEKVYIPSKEEVALGFFEGARYKIESGVIDNNDPSMTDSIQSQGGVNINTSSQKDIEGLPGIGPATAEKIINSRPYGDIQELLSKKIIGEALFNKIKSQITVD